MSHSPNSISSADPPFKRRKSNNQILASSSASSHAMDPQSPTTPLSAHHQQQQPVVESQTHVPKRGARACTACRKGKNRCEGEAPCRRCQLSGQPCIFEKPEKKKDTSVNMVNGSTERVARLEGQCMLMQSQMIGLQSSLDQILAHLQTRQVQLPSSHSAHTESYSPIVQTNARNIQSQYASANGPPRGTNDLFNPSDAGDHHPPSRNQKSFPPLPGFAPPPHKYATYGIVPSTAPSSDDESEDTLPRSSLNAPIEALQGLANAAAEAAAAPSSTTPRVKKRKRAEPTPRNAFPHVVEKGLVSDAEARELFALFFSGCHLFIPLFDPAYDTYESIKERSPWTFDAILAVASKIRSAGGPLTSTFYKCLEEAQGIARSSLFGPVVRKEAVQGMLLLAAWSTNGWLPSGHAMRMALDLGLHRALEKLADTSAKHRTEEEERNLVVSTRIWLCLYWFDHQMSLGTGRPIVLRDESSIRHCRLLLTHRMASPTDVRLISQVELMAQKTQIYESLSPLNGIVNHNTLLFIRRANDALTKWYNDNDELHARTLDEESLPRKILAGELHYAKLWLVCVAMRGASWDKMPFEQRELAFDAKDAASTCLNIFLNTPTYRAALRYAVHDSLVTAAFSGLFLLKMANLFPADLDLAGIMGQVEQLAVLLSEVAAERYALTLRIMLHNLHRKLTISMGGTNGAPIAALHANNGIPQRLSVGPDNSVYIHQPSINVDTGSIASASTPSPQTYEELGLAWASAGGERSMFSPSPLPLWLQEGSLTDLGIPMNGSDDIFLQLANANGWTGDFAPMPEAW